MNSADLPCFVRSPIIWLFYVVGGLYAFVPSALGPILPFAREELHYSYSVAAFHFTALSLGVIIAGTVGDRVLNAVGRRRCLWLGVAGVCLGILVLTFGHQVVLTISGAYILGMFGSLMGQTIDTVMAETLGDQRTVAITEINVLTSLCAGMAPAAVSGFVKIGFGWRASLWAVIGLFAVAAAFGLRIKLPEGDACNASSRPGECFAVAACVLAFLGSNASGLRQ